MARRVLSDALAAHFAAAPGMYAAASEGREVPELTRVLAACFEPESDVVRFVVADAFSERFVRALASHPRAALVAAKVDVYEAYQLKGRVLAVEPATEADLHIVEEHLARFCALVAPMGIDPVRYPQAFAVPPYSTVRVEVDAVFDQTPRLGAGALVAGAGAQGAR